MLHCKTSVLRLFSLQMKTRASSWIAWLKKRVSIGTLHHDLFSMTSEVMDSGFRLLNTSAGGSTSADTATRAKHAIVERHGLKRKRAMDLVWSKRSRRLIRVVPFRRYEQRRFHSIRSTRSAKPNQEKEQMKGLIASALFCCACIGLVLANSPKSLSKDPAVIDAVKQVEQDMGKAMMSGDTDKLNQIYADDFATFGSSGKIITKQDLLSDFESFHDKLEWFEVGPMDVQVFGNVAVAQGSVKEKRSRNGKDTSGEFAWMDLLEKRAGKWVVLRSASARLVLADWSKVQSQDPKAVETIKQFEQEIGDAMVAGNIEKLNQSYADDWATLASSGKIVTKENLLSDFKSGKHKLVSFENGPMDVQVLGDVAVVQASVSEKRIQDGKDISGEFVYMDLLKKRAGRWMVVRTLGARVS
jgi:ketosteroid isomerase-like protein